MTIKEIKKICATMRFYANQVNYCRTYNVNYPAEEIDSARVDAVEFVLEYDFNIKVQRIYCGKYFAGFIIRSKKNVFFSTCLTYSETADIEIKNYMKEQLTYYGLQDAINIYSE